MNLNPHAVPARQRTALLTRGALAPDELARDTLARIAAADPALRAFVCTLAADSAAPQVLRLRGPQAGIPVAAKDIFGTQHLPTACGSAACQPPQPARLNAAIVALLRRAGALVIARSSTIELAYLHATATLNPNASNRTAGRSSAGSVATATARLAPLALNTQTGRSVIRPASYCGVVGYKRSFGWLPTAGLKRFSWSLDTVGLFARCGGCGPV